MKKLFFFIAFLFAAANSFAQTSTYVSGYTNSNGTYVQGYYRTTPNWLPVSLSRYLLLYSFFFSSPISKPTTLGRFTFISGECFYGVIYKTVKKRPKNRKMNQK